jgi:hypothetical protein
MRPVPLLFVLSCASLVHADATDPLRRDDVSDELSVARVADEAGDAALLKALAQGAARDLALVAARAAAHADAPELLVPRLVELAKGRDPALAPEATASLLAIFERLRPSELAAREVLLADLRRACDALAAATEVSMRPDLALALGFSAARCAELLGPTKS